MLKDKAIAAAKTEAKKLGSDIFVVEAPIEVRSANEYEQGPYAYGPEGGVAILYGFGVIVARVNPNGDVQNIVPPLVIDNDRFDAIKARETFESFG